MKKLLSVITIIVLLCSMLVVPVSAAGNGTIAMSSGSGKQGDTITLDVNMSKNPGLVTMTIKVTYDTNVLQLTSVSDPKLLVGSQLNTTYGSPYTISWVDGSATANNTKTGKIASFTFKIKDNAKVGATDVTLQFVDSFDTNFGENTFTATSGKITVNCKTHTYGAYSKVNDSQHKHTCTVCGYTETANHTWNGGSVTKTATCKETGIKTYTCTACNATKTETIAKTNSHNWSGYKVTKQPTCTAAGTQTRTCSVCGETESQSVAAKGHSWGSYKVTKEPTCTAAGIQTRTCSVCGETESQSVPATGHSYGDWATTKEPTCTEKGVDTRKCSKCSATETKDIAALGHKFSNPTVTKQPTCTETGIESGKCTRCGAETTNTLKATGHNFGSWKNDKSATCTEGGTQKRTCSKCNAVETGKTNALGHDFENPTIVKEATISTTGLKEGKCKRCGETTSEVIPCSAKDENTGIVFEVNEGVFAEGTQMTVEEIKTDNPTYESVKNILSEVTDTFTIYDISAVLNGAKVQPNGEVKVEFKIPDGYGTDVAVYYIADDGSYEKLESTISEDGKTVSAKLTHFSNYAVCKLGTSDTANTDLSPETTEQSTESNNTLWIIIAIVAVVLIAGAVATVIIVKNKKKIINI